MPALLHMSVAVWWHSCAQNLGSVPHDAVWNAVVQDCVHLAKVNQEAQLSDAPVVRLHMQVYLSLSVLAVACRDPGRHESLLKSGVVDALLYASAHDSSFLSTSHAAIASTAAVSLIGRNEKGLTLSRDAVGHVLKSFASFFDPSERYFKYPVKRVLLPAQGVADVSIADANKPFIVEHSGAIDGLVSGLLLEESNPRRQQDGAAKLQETCALALQNLALSGVGKGPLRSHSGVMRALRELASSESTGGVALSEEARRCASGALFELDESSRQRRQPLHTAAAVEHVMLSYNWDHQVTIKRINAGLKARGYAVWIDIEKMQGSTVEVMSAAIEDAAVMCCGISQSYKESANCRLEAQYGHQQETEMVPLMMEEGYRPNGWLGMLLGVRLWYGFCGPVLESEGAFESKMEELCRELGDRGLSAAESEIVSVGDDRDGLTELGGVVTRDLESQLRQLDGGQRTSAVEEALECANGVLKCAPRKERTELRQRIEHLLGQLDQADEPAWVVEEWTPMEASAVGGAMQKVRSVEGSSSRASAEEVTGAVVGLLGALEVVESSHVDQYDVLLMALQSGGDEVVDSIVGVLGHGLDVLDALSMTTPRKRRKAVESVCERVESVMASIEEGGATPISANELSSLSQLAEDLCAVKSLKLDEAEGGCVGTVSRALDQITRCCDRVAGARRLVVSVEASDRLRGLTVLRGLERVVQAEAVECEVLAAEVVGGMVSMQEGRSMAEIEAALVSVFVLCFRNGPIEGPLVKCLDWDNGVMRAVFEGRAGGREAIKACFANGFLMPY